MRRKTEHEDEKEENDKIEKRERIQEDSRRQKTIVEDNHLLNYRLF